MTDDVWKRDEVDSPCIKVCVLDPKSGYCLGCFRTGDEIARWSKLGNDARRAIIGSLSERESAHRPARRGGRSRHLRNKGASDPSQS